MNLKEIEKEIQDISAKERLYSLANLEELKFDGENALGFLSRITKTRNKLNNRGEFDLITHDLVNSVSSDIRFALANAYLYFPHTNNFIKEVQTYSDGQEIPTFFMKIEDKRFFFYVNTVFEKLYIFWDRIGDILAKSFNLDIREDRVYFSTVMSALEEKLLLTESGRWLKVFHENEYNNILNRLRIKIVHYRQKDTYFYMEWLKMTTKHATDPSQIARLQQEKEELLPLLREQLHFANMGFENMVRFIADQGIYEKEINLKIKRNSTIVPDSQQNLTKL